jgi:hypothetical protein
MGRNVGLFVAGVRNLGKQRRVIGSEEIERRLLDPITMTRWCHLNLLQRCEKIQLDWGVDVKKERLRRFYKQNGVSFKPTKVRLYPHGWDPEELEQLRFRYAEELCEHIFDRETIVLYFDESAMNCWQTQKKAWYVKG